MPRPDTTVIIRTPGLLLRADVRGREAPLVTQWREADFDATSAVTHALREGGRPGKRVWVLDSEVWLGLVGLSGGAVAGLSDKELAEPAAFEAEAISDLRPDEAVTAVQRRRVAEQDDQFLVAQTRRADVVAIAKALRGAGAKLAGITHPAGLVEPLTSPGSESGATDTRSPLDWRRVEFWSDSVVLVESVARRVHLIPLGVGPGTEWRRALKPFLRGNETVGHEQALLAPGVRVRGGPTWRESLVASGTARWLAVDDEQTSEEDTSANGEVPVWDLADDAAASTFAAAWARRLATAEESTRKATSPILRPPKGPAARWPAVMVGVIALAASVAIIVQQRLQVEHQLQDVQAQIGRAEASAKVAKDRRKEAQQASSDVKAKRRAVAELERQLEEISRKRASSRPVDSDRRGALAALMAAVTDSASEETVIQSIEHSSPEHKISGTALTPEAASRLARELSLRLRDHWTVNPAEIEPQPGSLRPNSQRPDLQQVVWRFSVELVPLVHPESHR